MSNAANQPPATPTSSPASQATSSTAGPIAQQLVQLQTQNTTSQGVMNNHAAPAQTQQVPSQNTQGATKNASPSKKTARICTYYNKKRSHSVQN